MLSAELTQWIVYAGFLGVGWLIRHKFGPAAPVPTPPAMPPVQPVQPTGDAAFDAALALAAKMLVGHPLMQEALAVVSTAHVKSQAAPPKAA